MKTKLFRRLTAAAILVSLMAVTGQSAPDTAYAAVPKLDTIRVALILESGKLKSTVPAVTVSAAQGLNVQFKTAAAANSWPADLSLNSKVKALPDGYKVLLLETSDYTKAKALADQLKPAGATVLITPTERSSKKVYQVIAAGYTTKEAASQGLTALSQLPAVSALTDKPVLRGPLHLAVGAYDTAAEAKAQQAALAQAGVDSMLAVVEKSGGGLQTAVWTGSETDSDALQAYKLKVLSLMPALQPAAADTSKPYVLVQYDAMGSSDGSPTASLLPYAVQGVKLLAAPKDGEMTVAEKSNRTYRGTMEISVTNGKLSLINELPFEQYLYSVVSGEMGKGWPAEALKAQAVAARTYALKSGTKYEGAHVSDSTLDQVYDGNEDADSVQAVDATKGEVLINKDGLITAFFSANAGGMTSKGDDVWGTAQSYLKTGPSPDEGAAKNKAVWKRCVLPDGRIAYISSAYLKSTGAANAVGLPIYQVTEEGVNARSGPYVDNTNNPSIAKLNAGDKVTVFAEAQESNAYSWIRGPYTQEELLKTLNDSLASMKLGSVQGPLTSLEVTGRGDSGRVTAIAANGKSLQLSSPDSYRTMLGGLPSTRFEITRTGGYTIQGAAGSSALPSDGTLYAVSAGGQAQALKGADYFVLNGAGQVNYATRATTFTFNGKGSGHGLGMSQWGARGLADMGYDYKKILSYYYEGVTLTKE